MKLTIEQRKQIYEKRCHGYSCKELSKEYHTDLGVIKYLCRFSEMYGPEVFTKKKNIRFSKSFKQNAIDRVLKGESIKAVSLDLCLSSPSSVQRWVSEYNLNGGRIKEKKRGKPPMPGKKPKKAERKLTAEEKMKKLEEENLYLRAENAYLKKLDALVQERQAREQGKKPKSSKS